MIRQVIAFLAGVALILGGAWLMTLKSAIAEYEY